MALRSGFHIAWSLRRRSFSRLGLAVAAGVFSCIGTVAAQRAPHHHFSRPPLPKEAQAAPAQPPKQAQPPQHPKAAQPQHQPKHAQQQQHAQAKAPHSDKQTQPSHPKEAKAAHTKETQPAHAKEAKAPHSKGAQPQHSKQTKGAHSKETQPSPPAKQTHPTPPAKQTQPTPPTQQAHVEQHPAHPVQTLPAPPIAPPVPPPPPAAAQTNPPEKAAEATSSDAEPPMKLGTQPQQQQEKAAEGKPPTPPTGEKSRAKKADEEKAGLRRSFAQPLPPKDGTYDAREVLATSLSPEARERLRQRGYTLTGTPGSGLVRLILPEGLDSWTAQRQLESEFQQGFALNFFYELFGGRRGHPELDSAPVAGLVPASGSRGCTTERCYGRKVIGWQDHLAACARGVKIGIIDTGYDEYHPAFKDVKVKPTVIMSASGSARAPDWHGTGVISLLAAAATSSTPGFVPDADFLIADAFFKNENGRPRTDTAHVVEALRLLDERGAQIINMSLVGPRDDLVHERIVDMVRRKGVVFIAAAGNGGPSAPPGYPAAYSDEVIAVTAVDDRRRTYDYANRGSYIDVSAPGVRIWTAQPRNQEGMLSGTSFAAPFVTAIAAVIYNGTPLRALAGGKGRPLDPKGTMLAAFAIEKLGNGERNNQYGLGLVTAPSACAPAQQPVAVPAEKPPAPPAAAALSPWQTDVKRTSLR